MTVNDFASWSTIPKRILTYLHQSGVIDDPLSSNDIVCLQFLESLWGNKEIIRAQLNRLSLNARQSFLRTAHLNAKWQRYAFSRFFNMPAGRKLPLSALIDEIQTTYQFRLTPTNIKSLRLIRNRAQVAKFRSRNRQNCH